MDKLFHSCAAVVLAAGKGTRMGTDTPKVLRRLLGQPMLGWVLDACAPLFGNNIYIVAGHGAEQLMGEFSGRNFIVQSPQLGTGHALSTALAAMPQPYPGRILVVNGDCPLLAEASLASFAAAARDADLAFATLSLPNPRSYGRVARKNGVPCAIVEAKDYDAAIHGPETGEVNAGLYLMKTGLAQKLLPLIGNANKSGEYYLTDLVALAFDEGLQVEAVPCGGDEGLLGVNTPQELAEAENILAGRITEKLLENGVIVHAPQFLRCGPHVEIAKGAEIAAPCEIYGETRIGSGAVVEAYCVIEDSEIAPGARIRSFSHLEKAFVGHNAIAGPYCRLRPGAGLEENSHAGNFVELKNAVLGPGAKANHLSYLGDAKIGAGTNIGAGTITCNYDGKLKHRTTIGENAFIGSNTALVAPVEIGSSALVGAGSTITKNVPAGSLAIARARQQNLARKKK